jgi:GH15 family glucan-1,4-alpha-glucosidase
MAVVFRMFGREDPRASALLDATLRELDCAPFVYRYEPGGDDGFSGREGAFLPASWWAVSALAACGRVADAQERARALDRALPALMPEEMDPESRVGLGNVRWSGRTWRPPALRTCSTRRGCAAGSDPLRWPPGVGSASSGHAWVDGRTTR